MTSNPVTDDPERIFLEPKCCIGPEGRQWCEDNVWPVGADCEAAGVEYVRADLAMQAAHTPPSDDVLALLHEVADEIEQGGLPYTAAGIRAKIAALPSDNRISELEAALRPFWREASRWNMEPSALKYSFANTGLSRGDIKRAADLYDALLSQQGGEKP